MVGPYYISMGLESATFELTRRVHLTSGLAKHMFTEQQRSSERVAQIGSCESHACAATSVPQRPYQATPLAAPR